MTKKTEPSAPQPAHPVPAAGPSPGWLPAVQAIPAVPEGEKPLDTAGKQTLLKLAMEQRAEVDQALEELWQKRAQVAQDLGTLAPNAEHGQALYARMTESREVHRAAAALAAYTGDQELLANHGALSYLNEVAGDIEHMAQKNPQVAARYSKVLAVASQRREAIAAGIARAKAAKGEPSKG